MPDAAAISADYRQAARRIRARLGHRPPAMFAALRDLATAQPSAPAPVTGEDRATPQPAGEAFSELVLDHLEGPVLRFHVRQKLLRRADEMGLGRFEANLLVALVEHRHRQMTPISPLPTRRAWPKIAVFLLIQAAIIAAAWIALAA